MFAILFAVCPSQRGGTLGLVFSCDIDVSINSDRFCESFPTRVLLPDVIVIGRSVFARTVKQGVFKKVVSSCTPPESVMTKLAWFSRARNSRYPPGSILFMFSS